MNKKINGNPIVREKRFGRRAAMGSWEGLTCRPATLRGSSGEESDRRSSRRKKVFDCGHCFRPATHCDQHRQKLPELVRNRSVIGEQRHSELVVQRWQPRRTEKRRTAAANEERR